MSAINKKALFLAVGFIVLSGVNILAQHAPQIVDYDFDGDGRSDPAIYRTLEGTSQSEWWYLKSSNNQGVGTQFGIEGDFPVAADYTGDGITDMAFFRRSTGEWFVIRSEDGSFYSFTFGNGQDLAMTGDFDGDGKADPTVYRPSTKLWYTIKSSNGEIIVRQFGASGDRPKIADFDGDGKDDIAVYRPSTRVWWIDQSTDGIVAYEFGIDVEELHGLYPADYTGDGKADLAFIEAIDSSEGRQVLRWFILRSENPSSYYAFIYGRGGDKPAIGDYDGDGETDVALYRPLEQNWYILRSASGQKIVSFGSNGDTPVALFPSTY